MDIWPSSKPPAEVFHGKRGALNSRNFTRLLIEKPSIKPWSLLRKNFLGAPESERAKIK
jgi:hypothetical protein